MISKIFPGHSFYHACRYICKDEDRSLVLATEGVRAHDYKLMAEDFIRQHDMRPSKTQACFHAVLSFYPGEKPSDEKMAAIAKEYLEAIGIKNTQYAITKHIDKDHLHLHVLANMVNNEGKTISDSWIALRGKRAAQQLTIENNLTQALKKELTLTHMESLSQSEANKYKIYMAISESLPKSRNMEELGTALLKLGIETQYKYKGQTQEKQGVSFKIGDDCFKGSKVDRQFSYGNLQRTLELQLRQSLEQHPELSHGSEMRDRRSLRNSNHRSDQNNENFSVEMSKGMEKSLEILMRQERDADYMPEKLMEEEKRRKRRQRQNRGMER